MKDMQLFSLFSILFTGIPVKVKCYKCGTVIDVVSPERPLKVQCPKCGVFGLLQAPVAPLPSQYQYQPSSTYPSPSPPPPIYGSPPQWLPRKEEGKWHLVSGILLVLAGAIALGNAAYYLLIALLFGSFSPISNLGLMNMFFTLCGVISIISGILGILGGVFAIKRTNWAVAFIGSILTIWTVLGLLALVFLVIGKDEFT